MNYKILLWSGFIIALLSYLMWPAAIGILFLMQLTTLFGVYLMCIGITQIPFRNTRVKVAAKYARISLLSLAAVCIVLFTVIEIIIYCHIGGEQDMSAGTVIVLGAGVYGETPSASLASRLDKAFEYLTNNEDCIAVLSGGQGKGELLPEAQAMKKYLMELGIAEQRLLLEEKSSSTIENISFSLPILKDYYGFIPNQIAIISNDFHLYRAERIASHFGLKPIMISAPLPNIGLVPLNCWTREFFSIIILSWKELFCKELFLFP